MANCIGYIVIFGMPSLLVCLASMRSQLYVLSVVTCKMEVLQGECYHLHVYGSRGWEQVGKGGMWNGDICISVNNKNKVKKNCFRSGQEGKAPSSY